MVSISTEPCCHLAIITITYNNMHLGNFRVLDFRTATISQLINQKKFDAATILIIVQFFSFFFKGKKMSKM